MAFYPYLFFGGDCREAFELYKQVRAASWSSSR